MRGPCTRSHRRIADLGSILQDPFKFLRRQPCFLLKSLKVSQFAIGAGERKDQEIVQILRQMVSNRYAYKIWTLSTARLRRPLLVENAPSGPTRKSEPVSIFFLSFASFICCQENRPFKVALPELVKRFLDIQTAQWRGTIGQKSLLRKSRS
jgi:hypothetical protein